MDDSFEDFDAEVVDELGEDRLWPHDPDGPSWAPMEPPPQQTKKRGRKKIPEKWTRVISISNDSPEDLETFEIKTDILTKDERLIYPRQRRMA